MVGLVFPTLEMERDALAYRQEFFNYGEEWIHGSAGLSRAESYPTWIEKINDDLTRDDGEHIPGAVYFAVDEGFIVGMIAVRYKLNDYLLKFGGHIGYGVRPSQRRKGYASQMLELALEKCRALGIGRVLITCDDDNIGSARTAEKNGGVLENKVEEEGKITRRYWIEIKNG
jgi:Predicted acetyltransferase